MLSAVAWRKQGLVVEPWFRVGSGAVIPGWSGKEEWRIG